MSREVKCRKKKEGGEPGALLHRAQGGGKSSDEAQARLIATDGDDADAR
jgi:hypothetical protein